MSKTTKLLRRIDDMQNELDQVLQHEQSDDDRRIGNEQTLESIRRIKADLIAVSDDVRGKSG